MEPKYGENIIVATVFKKKFQWYCTDKSFWKLDYRRLYEEYQETYRRRGKGLMEFTKEVGSFGEFISSRYRIPVLDKDTAKDFFRHIITEQTSAGELGYALMRAENDESKRALYPSLFVDFDGKRFFSMYPENEPFERYAPAGWQSARADFTSLIPQDERYWTE